MTNYRPINESQWRCMRENSMRNMFLGNALHDGIMTVNYRGYHLVDIWATPFQPFWKFRYIRSSGTMREPIMSEGRRKHARDPRSVLPT